jgi:hypothetical protein
VLSWPGGQELDLRLNMSPSSLGKGSAGGTDAAMPGCEEVLSTENPSVQTPPGMMLTDTPAPAR